MLIIWSGKFREGLQFLGQDAGIRQDTQLIVLAGCWQQGQGGVLTKLILDVNCEAEEAA